MKQIKFLKNSILCQQYTLKSNQIIRRTMIISFALVILLFSPIIVRAEDIELVSPSVILMDGATGDVLYEKNADEQRSPASITKLMTLYLIFESLHNGKIGLQDMVETSEYAKSMGGSQVFLETGERQTVDTLIKCIIIASGNDASVAMAEYISGSENAFVELMNQKAKELGMNNTHFCDCCGLTNDTNHYTTARDIALLSKCILDAFPEILNYSGIWMEDIVHVTAKGESVFTLSSTNKLLKLYEYTTGLKTGSTSTAKYCLSATACKEDRQMIVVIMGAPESKTRFTEAKTLLEYGYNKTKLYKDESDEEYNIPIKLGKQRSVVANSKTPFLAVLPNEYNENNISKEVKLLDDISAPIDAGYKVGECIYYLNNQEIGRVDIISNDTVMRITWPISIVRILKKYLL